MAKRYAVIIGASRGIGQAVAVTLARRGFETILIGRTKSGLKTTASQCDEFCRAHVLAGDITSELSTIIRKIKKITPKIHLVWLGAAGFAEKPISKSSPELIKELIRSGYEALVEFVHRAYPMLRSGQAQIIGACSDWSEFHSGGPSIFGSTKVALAGFLDKLREEVRADGISVAALKMGNVGNLEGYSLGETERQLRETGRKMVSLQDVCEAVEFILSRRTGVVSELTLVPGE
jgi:short-subunit dehydrogenase